MGQITVDKTPLEGLYVVSPAVHGDGRGYFVETYSRRDMHQAGLTMEFVQDNQSVSARGVLRGLHFQMRHPQGKLVRTVQGAVFDAVVDLRPGSASRGQWFGLELSEDNHRQLYIPPGFAHGFLTLSERAVICYKVTDFYCPGDEGGLAWNDPQLAIQWPIVRGTYSGSARAEGCCLSDGTPLCLNERDQSWPALSALMEDTCYGPYSHT